MFGLGRQPDKIIKRGTAKKRERETVETKTVESFNSSSDSNVDRDYYQREYNQAKAVWERTGDRDHWQYMQRCADKL